MASLSFVFAPSCAFCIYVHLESALLQKNVLSARDSCDSEYQHRVWCSIFVDHDIVLLYFDDLKASRFLQL